MVSYAGVYAACLNPEHKEGVSNIIYDTSKEKTVSFSSSIVQFRKQIKSAVEGLDSMTNYT